MLFAGGGKGLNITVPFKQDAYAYVARTTPGSPSRRRSEYPFLEADGTILGDTTDGVGLVSDIKHNLGWQIRHKKVLILGAEGAVRGVLGPLLEKQPQHIIIANRTVDKALQLAKGFALSLVIAVFNSFDMLDEQQFDVIINGTSAGYGVNCRHCPSV